MPICGARSGANSKQNSAAAGTLRASSALPFPTQPRCNSSKSVSTYATESGVRRRAILANIDRELVLGVGGERLELVRDGWKRLMESGLIETSHGGCVEADRFNHILKSLHWSKETLADMLGCDTSLVEAIATSRFRQQLICLLACRGVYSMWGGRSDARQQEAALHMHWFGERRTLRSHLPANIEEPTGAFR